MTDPADTDPGDYGYDMAHEGVPRGRPGTPSATADQEARERHGTARPGGTSDRGEDMGYDEAHDF